MALNLCKADSKTQHKNPIQKIIIPQKLPSPVPQTPDRVYAKLGSVFEELDFFETVTLFLKQVRVGAERTSSGKSFQTVGASKA